MSDGFTHSKRYHENALKWTKENSRKTIEGHISVLQKCESLNEAAKRGGVSVDHLAKILRKHGQHELLEKYDDRPNAAQRRVENFVYDPQNPASMVQQRAAQRIKNRVESVQRFKSIVKAAYFEDISINALTLCLQRNGHAELVHKYDDRQI